MSTYAGSAMAGLSVLLETTGKQQLQSAERNATTPPHIISKGTMAAAPSPAASPMSLLPAATSSSFLHRCFLCRRELADGVDIYIYRGDRAFCSEECRCRHILLEDEDGGAVDCARVAAADRSRRRRRQAADGGFALW